MNIFFKILFILSFVKFKYLIELNDLINDSIVMFENYFDNQINIKTTNNESIKIIVKSFTLNLSKNIRLLSNKCLLNGQIIIESQLRGEAMLSFCNDSDQLVGILEIDGRTYSISPENIDNTKNVSSVTENTKSRKKREISRHSIREIKEVEENCGEDPTPEDYIRYMKSKEVPDDPNINFGEATVEVAVYMDQWLYKYTFREDMHSISEYITINFAYLQKQLLQKNLEKHIKIKIVIIHFAIAPFDDTHDWSCYTYLKKFCTWRKNITQADVHILFTGSNIWNKENDTATGREFISTSRMGLAYRQALCGEWYPCILLEGRQLYRSLHLLVHEFGHTLGATHDGIKDLGTQNCDLHKFIMSYGVANGRNTWSNCSITWIRKYLLTLERSKKTNRIQCLKNATEILGPQMNAFDITSIEARKPGLKIDLDQQCRNIFGPHYSAHYTKHTFRNVCSRIECKSDFYVVSAEGALEGTKCGENMICDRDLCKRPAD